MFLIMAHLKLVFPYYRTALTRNPPDVRAASTERPALHVGGLGIRGETPPHQLQEPTTYPVPTFLTDQRLIDEEKPVYYWFYRHVRTLHNTMEFGLQLRLDVE